MVLKRIMSPIKIGKTCNINCKREENIRE